MARIEIPKALQSSLGSEMKMDVHWIDVALKDGRKLKNLVVRGGAFITGRNSDPGGEGKLNFASEDIIKVRRHSWLPFF